MAGNRSSGTCRFDQLFCHSRQTRSLSYSLKPLASLLCRPTLLVLQVNDSSAIISRLNAELTAQQQLAAREAGAAASSGNSGWLSVLFGSGGGSSSSQGSNEEKPSCCAAKKREEEEKWRRWVDDWFVKVGGVLRPARA